MKINFIKKLKDVDSLILSKIDQNMKKIHFFFIFIFGLLFSGYLWVSYYFSTKLAFFKTKTLEEEVKTYKIKSYKDVGLDKPEELRFSVNDILVDAWYFQGNRGCGIIFHHGFSATRIRVLKYYPLFKEYQCHLLFFDARHHGNSSGSFTTYGYYEKQDLIEIINEFQKKTNLVDHQIALVGESMGASILIQFAGYTKRKFKMILADSPYSEFKTIVKERASVLYTKYSLIFLPGTFLFYNLRTQSDYNDVSPKRYAKDVITPIFIVHSKADDYTRFYHSQDIYKNLNLKEKELILTDWNSKHVESIDDNFEAYNQYLKDFIKKYNITF